MSGGCSKRRGSPATTWAAKALVNRIWKWKDAYEERILGQLKQLGASCDWRRTRFTLDDICTFAVRRTFFKFFADGLIYRGKRLVNWDTFLQTAVADDEVFHEDVDGFFWTFTYPVIGSEEPIAFATTRPETMLGDTAICVNPADDRYRHLIGKKVRIPLNNREIPIIGDAILAKMDMGTGAVKVTPAHDPNDYACGLRHKLPMINILNPDGSLNQEAGEYAGMDRSKARELIVEKMSSLGHLVNVEERKIPWRTATVPKRPSSPSFRTSGSCGWRTWLSGRWTLSRTAACGSSPPAMPKRISTGSAKNATGASAGSFGGDTASPSGTATRAPRRSCSKAFAGRDDIRWRRDDETNNWLICSEVDLATDALGPKHKLVQDEDVLDTWFSSALWPQETLGWPEKTASLAYFYPTSVLVTSREIITLWVARMVITGLYNMGDVPFRHVYIHPKILDGFGQTMSKSRGNGVDPMDLIDKYGTDAVRFTIASMAGETQDVRLPVGYECPHCQTLIPQTLAHQKAAPRGGVKPRVTCPKCKKSSQYSTPGYEADPGEPVARIVSERFEYGRNFCNKLWNAARFVVINLEGYSPAAVTLEELRLKTAGS